MHKSFFPNSIFICYLVILCWAPLPFGSNRPWAILLLCLLIFVLALLVLGQAAKARLDMVDLLRSWWPALLLLGLVPLWVTLQGMPLPAGLVSWLSPNGYTLWRDSGAESGWLTLSLEPGMTRQMALLSWAFWVFFVLTLLLVDSGRRLRRLMTVIVLCGVVQALYGSFMTLSELEYGFFVEKTAYVGRATGTFVNRNHLAGYLEMSLAVGIGLLVASLNRQKTVGWHARLRNLLDTLLGPKMRLRLYLALMVIALVLTRSRMGNTAFFVSLTVCGLFLLIRQRRLSSGALVLFASLLLVDFFIVGQWFGFEEVVQRLENTSAEVETRDEVVRDSLTMWRDYPLVGTGAGTFYSSFPQYRGSDVRQFYDHAHNDYLEFAATLGVVGLLPLAGSVLLALGAAIMVLVRRRYPLAMGAAFAGLMGIVSLLIHSLVDFNLQIPANGLLFLVLLALVQLARTLGGDRGGRSASRL